MTSGFTKDVVRMFQMREERPGREAAVVREDGWRMSCQPVGNEDEDE